MLKPEPLPIFPTYGSLQEVLDLAESRLPITNQNDLKVLLFSYHNTLLAQLHHPNHEDFEPWA